MRRSARRRPIALVTSRIVIAGALCLASLAGMPAFAQTSDLVSKTAFRVCADPANFPLSDKSEAGFENKIAELMASELGLPLEYTWFPMATGFIRKTLQANACDVVIGYAQGDEMVLNTNHYYRSAYALVVKKDSDLASVTELSDERLKGKHLGVVAGTPPATIMNRLGLIASAKPYQLFVDRRYNSPTELMIKDIRSGDIDGGILWGPNAGFFANQGGDDLAVIPLLKEGRSPPMTFRITMGVRQSDATWKRELNEIITKRQGDIDQILLDFHIPIVDEADQQITSARRSGG